MHPSNIPCSNSSKLIIMVVLILLWLLCSFIINTVDGCTEGFIDIGLLRVKAEQIPNIQDNYSNNILDSNSRWLFPSLRFTCSTTITGVIIGVDVRTITNTRNSYPQLEIWSPNNANNVNVYNQVSSSIRTIQLQPDNFTTSGVYTYQFCQPLSVQMNDILGIYQPPHSESVVRVHYESSSNTAYKLDSPDDEYVNVNSNAATPQDLDLIIYPLTDNPSCLGTGFQTSEMIQSKVLQVTDVLGPANIVRGFSDIRFTCDGIITKWIVGINDVTGNILPNIQLIRSNMTVITSLTVNTNNGTSTNTNVYEFTSLLNAEVKTGDILVVNSTDVPVYYQQFNGPQNYMIDSSNTLVEVEENNYPLISVEFVPTSSSSLVETASPLTTPVEISTSFSGHIIYSSVVISSSSSVDMTSSSSSVDMTSSSEIVVDMTPSSSPVDKTPSSSSVDMTSSSVDMSHMTPSFSPVNMTSSSSSVGMTSSPNTTSSLSVDSTTSPSANVPVLLIGVGTSLLLLFIIIFTSVLIIILLVKYRRTKQMNSKLKVAQQSHELVINPSYSTHTVSDKLITIDDYHVYDVPNMDNTNKQVTNTDNPVYDSVSESEHVITDDNPSYNIHTVSDKHNIITTDDYHVYDVPDKQVTNVDNPVYDSVSDEHMSDNPSYDIHMISDEHVITDDNPSYNIHRVSGEYSTVDENDTRYSYVVHVLDEPLTMII